MKTYNIFVNQRKDSGEAFFTIKGYDDLLGKQPPITFTTEINFSKLPEDIQQLWFIFTSKLVSFIK